MDWCQILYDVEESVNQQTIYMNSTQNYLRSSIDDYYCKKPVILR